MSAPRKIWVDDVSAAYPNIAFVDNGSENVYHHDDVVRELVEAIEDALLERRHSRHDPLEVMYEMERRLSAALEAAKDQ